MKKKYIIVSVALIFIIGKLLIEKLDNKPFRFEDFKNKHQGQLFFENHYKIKSKASYLLYDSFRAGAVCKELALINQEKNFYKDIIRCAYNSGWLSIPPLVDYVLVIYIGFDNEILKIEFNNGYVGP